VLKAGQMQQQALLVIQDNQQEVINQMRDDQLTLLRDGYREYLDASEQGMVAPDGNVNLKQYKAYVTDLAESMTATETMLRQKAEQARTGLNAQITAALALGRGVQSYNEAAGISDRTFQNLLHAGAGLVETGTGEYGKYRERRAAEDTVDQAAKLQRQQIQTTGLLEFLQKVHQSKQEGGKPLTPSDVQALIDALNGAASPPSPPAANTVQPK
jgi:hypothetical protein